MITFDIIGTLHSTIIAAEDGEYVSGGDPLPGYHINTIPEVPGWEQYRIEPNTKRRVFAGLAADTVCYVFPDEAAFRDACSAAGVPDPLEQGELADADLG